MKWIASFFVRAKSWQIFILLFGVMVLSQIAAATADAEKMLPRIWGFTLLFMLCFEGWFWALGTFLNSIVRPALRPGVSFFRFALIYPMIYLPVFMLVFPPSPKMLTLIFPLHLFAMVCIFYLLNFVSKNLVLAEAGKEVSFYDYSGPFFLLWFFPIGVWVVQPRINALYAESKLGEDHPGEAAASPRV